MHAAAKSATHADIRFGASYSAANNDLTAPIKTCMPTVSIIKEAISAAIVSARKCPYGWSLSGGFCEIFSPISTAADATISVRLLKPSATSAPDTNQ
ncbi:hypothetical protein D3C79_902550 [compost metagenome]